jgi:hypothetical protein
VGAVDSVSSSVVRGVTLPVDDVSSAFESEEEGRRSPIEVSLRLASRGDRTGTSSLWSFRLGDIRELGRTSLTSKFGGPSRPSNAGIGNSPMLMCFDALLFRFQPKPFSCPEALDVVD